MLALVFPRCHAGLRLRSAGFCGVRGGDTLQCTGFAPHLPFDRYIFLHQQHSSRLFSENTLLVTSKLKKKFPAAVLLAPSLLPGEGFRCWPVWTHRLRASRHSVYRSLQR